MEFYALWVNGLVPYPAFLSSEPRQQRQKRQQRQRTVTGKQHELQLTAHRWSVGRIVFDVMSQRQFTARFHDQ